METRDRGAGPRPQNRPCVPGGTAELMPGKKPQSRAVRFCPPHK